MNFEIIDWRTFSIDGVVYKRLFYARKRGDLISIVNVLSRKILIADINYDTITIDDEHIQNLNQLEAVLYNKSCVCEKEGEDNEFKIFDETFDNTFE